MIICWHIDICSLFLSIFRHIMLLLSSMLHPNQRGLGLHIMHCHSRSRTSGGYILVCCRRKPGHVPSMPNRKSMHSSCIGHVQCLHRKLMRWSQGAGKVLFACCMGLWCYLIVVLLASVDFPIELPVGDLSRLISGASQRKGPSDGAGIANTKA